MAAKILPAATNLATQYKLPEQDRQAILAQAPAAQLAAAIKCQRQQFIEMHGCPFDLEQTKI